MDIFVYCVVGDVGDRGWCFDVGGLGGGWGLNDCVWMGDGLCLDGWIG